MNYSNTEIEKAILGSLLEYKDEAIEQALSVLDEIDFTSPKCRETWKAIKEMHNKGMKIDLILTTKYITNKNCGVNASDITDFYNCQTTLSYFCQYIYDLREYRIKREVQLIVDEKKEDFLEELEERFEEIKRLQISKEMFTKKPSINFKKTIERKRKFRVVGKYGIKYLDDYLKGILERDLVLIGAESGVGKSELAYQIAFMNSEKLRVHLFALESDEDEPILRKIYKLAAYKYYTDRRYSESVPYKEFNYRNFITNEVDMQEYEDHAIEILENKIINLNIWYKKDCKDINEFTKKIISIKDECDLIVLDHVDYLDLDDGSNENRQMTEIMKQIRNLNDVYGLPIVVISHLRKKSNRKQILPDKDDFFGSSNKHKQVKTVILLSKDHEKENYKDFKYGTFCKVDKCRVGGSNSLVGRLIFDAKENTYLDRYGLCKEINFGEEVVDIPENEYPVWATKFDKGEDTNHYYWNNF